MFLVHKKSASGVFIAALILSTACNIRPPPVQKSPLPAPSVTSRQVPIPSPELACQGLFPYNLSNLEVGALYWAFVLNFSVWKDPTTPVGCIVVYEKNPIGQTPPYSSTNSISRDCEVSGKVITASIQSPFTVIAGSAPTITRATFDGNSFIQCNFNLEGVLREAGLSRAITEIEKMNRDGYTGYEYFRMGAFGAESNTSQQNQPILYVQPHPQNDDSCDAADTLTYVKDEKCPSLGLFLNTGSTLIPGEPSVLPCAEIAITDEQYGVIQSIINGKSMKIGCNFPLTNQGLKPQVWGVGTDLKEGISGYKQDTVSYFQIDYEASPPINMTTEITTGFGITVVNFYTQDMTIYIGTTPRKKAGPMFTGDLYQIAVDPNGDAQPPH